MILISGAMGYIGSHTVVEMLNGGYEVLMLDNLSNSKVSVLDRIEQITNKRPKFIEMDIRDASVLELVFSEHAIEAVIHFAGLKAVGESVAEPLMYYEQNVGGTITLLQAMQKAGVKQMVFSSSATVYGDPSTVPIMESFPLSATNPYGQSKLMIEQIIRDLYKSDQHWKLAILRYFNPVGAHESGLIGEDPNGVPNNLMPFACQVLAGKLKELKVFGSDYPTPDGTGVRDYIHVVDLALGHICALKALKNSKDLITVNLGTGQGYSVLDVIRTLSATAGKNIPYRIVDRRPGDIAQYYSDPSLAEKLLGWKALRGIKEMCEDAIRWQVYASSLPK
jgi:UDP-glucose 4-epimerase